VFEYPYILLADLIAPLEPLVYNENDYLRRNLKMKKNIISIILFIIVLFVSSCAIPFPGVFYPEIVGTWEYKQGSSTNVSEIYLGPNNEYAERSDTEILFTGTYAVTSTEIIIDYNIGDPAFDIVTSRDKSYRYKLDNNELELTEGPLIIWSNVEVSLPTYIYTKKEE